MHLLVVDDFSPTAPEISLKISAQIPKFTSSAKPKEGLGWAYIRGMQYAVDKLGADAVMEMDADFQHPRDSSKIWWPRI